MPVKKASQNSVKIDGASKNPQEDLIAYLRKRAPEVFSEGKIDLKQLRMTLGDFVEKSEERYGFNWAGKQDCFYRLLEKISKTVKPVREESVNFNETENLFIEGDNLEVLKMLEGNYRGKVKMIYIDPPYNTGNDFIYNDNFSQTKKEYLLKAGMVDTEGNIVNADLLHHNTRDSGHFHSNWLNMMYPRLFLARNWLRDDGVIFVSIDDNEVKNLRAIMDEIFGEENFVAQFVWMKKKKGSHLSKTIRSMTEYVLAYAKSVDLIELFGEEAYLDKWQPLAKRTNSHKVLQFPTNIIETTLADGLYKAGKYQEGTSALDFKQSFTVSQGKIISNLSISGPFVWGQEMLNSELLAGTRVALSKQYGLNVLRYNQEEKVKRPSTLIDFSVGAGTNEDAYQELMKLMKIEGILDYPKPSSLIEYLVKSSTFQEKESVVLDFFAGSGTTAHSVMKLNAEDGGSRKWICIQLPEICREGTEAKKAGYKNIAEIAKERIRRAAKQIKEEYPEAKIDDGFKVFKVDESNFPEWRIEVENSEDLKQQMLAFSGQNASTVEEMDILYELLMKSGEDLNVKIEAKKADKKAYYRIGDGSLVICLDDLSESLFDAILADEPKKIIVVERGFCNDDELKVNLLLHAQDKGVEVRVG